MRFEAAYEGWNTGWNVKHFHIWYRRCGGQPSIGMDLAGSPMHQRLLAAYGKLHG